LKQEVLAIAEVGSSQSHKDLTRNL
jgi:hypothetical protein